MSNTCVYCGREYETGLNIEDFCPSDDCPGYEKAIIGLAKKRYEDEGTLEIDSSAAVSEGDDNGAYVQAWVWVDFSSTEFDKETK